MYIYYSPKKLSLQINAVFFTFLFILSSVFSYAQIKNSTHKKKTTEYSNTTQQTTTQNKILACNINLQLLDFKMQQVTHNTAIVARSTVASPPSNGFDLFYYIAGTNTPPGNNTVPIANMPSTATTFTLTNLLPNTIYFVWYRGNCGASGITNWYKLQFKTSTPCTPGNGRGTSTFGCPNVVAGGQGLDGADTSISTCAINNKAILEAKYLKLGRPTDYKVESIPFNPPYQFGCLANPVSVNKDDVWSDNIELPFKFCFYFMSNISKCKIGSNGVITFDPAIIQNTQQNLLSDWQCPGGITNMDTSLPSKDLFKSTIFGVFHDLNPKVGGTIGWELITLDSGCRALVAAWRDVPMFKDNTLLYTGMIVLYENTNVIEVYIKEKRIDNTISLWNGGNAIVGIQNSAAIGVTPTRATVPPSRNGDSPNWGVTEEAWRFVPNGNSITSIKWVEGTNPNSPSIGNGDTLEVNPTQTTTYTAVVTYSNMCALGGAALVETDQTTVYVGQNKVWNGSVNSNWYEEANWTPRGVPTEQDGIVIPITSNNPVIDGRSSAKACVLTVENGAELLVDGLSNITVTNQVNVLGNGVFKINDDSSLIQINDVTNTGNIIYERNTSIRKLDYVYWSSPVDNFKVSAISPNSPSNLIFKWNPTTSNPSFASNFGNWENVTDENMALGTGYIVRGPNNFTQESATVLNTNFKGVPNNGTIEVPIARDTYNGPNYPGPTSSFVTKDDDNWNLIGNPYPSSINAIDFLALNPNIEGYVKIWTHGTEPLATTPDPFYQDFVYNYSIDDYLTYNATGNNFDPRSFNGNIASCQGFFVLMNHQTASKNEFVTFNNSLRNSPLNNSFFKSTPGINSEDKNRIWLNLIDPINQRSFKTLVGYVDGASDEMDRLYDARTSNKPDFNFYSIVNDEIFTIQGKATPFNDDDHILLGYSIPRDGEYKIAIKNVDGLFSYKTQDIFLEDKLLKVIHNLKNEPYSFYGTKGTHNQRFVLKYNNKNNRNQESNLYNNQYNNHLNIFSNDEKLTFKSNEIKMENLSIYNIFGQEILKEKNISKLELETNKIKASNSFLLIKIVLENNIVITKKIRY